MRRILTAATAALLVLACDGTSVAPSPAPPSLSSATATPAEPTATETPTRSAPPTPSPTASPPSAAIPAVACARIDAAPCLALVDAALAALPADHPPVVSAFVGAACPDPEDVCLPFPVRSPSVVLEYANGGGIVEVPIEVAADGTTSLGQVEDWATSDTYDTFKAESDTARGEVEIITSHCGPVPFYVDFDGSLWDPSGTVDLTPLEPLGHVDRKVTVRLTSPDTAEVTGRRGFRLELVRHEGPKGLQAGCS